MPKSRELLERVCALIDYSGTIEFMVPQDSGWFSIESELIDRIRKLITDTADLARRIMDFYEEEEEPEPEELESEIDSDDTAALIRIGERISAELASREIADLAFVCRGQLLEILEAFDSAIERQEIWLVASNADTGLRRAMKGLITLEAAIREAEGLAPVDRYWFDLGDSLEIRRLYGQFRRLILRRQPQNPAELKMHLKSAATRIAILRDMKIYPLLRIDDRREIRNLQKRILAWLAGEGDASEDAGRRLWSDLVSFARLLVQVNNREELREHDRRVVAQLYHRLFIVAEPPERLTPDLLEDLETLLGRDDELDQIILEITQHPIEDLRAPLVRLRKDLGQVMRRPGV